VVAMDLPCDESLATFDTYADVVRMGLGGCDDDVMVVGHSLGGPTATWSRLGDRRGIWSICVAWFLRLHAASLISLRTSRTWLIRAGTRG
jgi:hypothetical protein